MWIGRPVIHRNFATGSASPLHRRPASRYPCSRSNGLRAGRSGRRQEQGFASKHLASLFLCPIFFWLNRDRPKGRSRNDAARREAHVTSSAPGHFARKDSSRPARPRLLRGPRDSCQPATSGRQVCRQSVRRAEQADVGDGLLHRESGPFLLKTLDQRRGPLHPVGDIAVVAFDLGQMRGHLEIIHLLAHGGKLQSTRGAGKARDPMPNGTVRWGAGRHGHIHKSSRRAQPPSPCGLPDR